jgi:hypothetical protein
VQQQDAVHAVVADQNDRLAGMAGEHQSQGIGRARRKVLQGFAVREADELWCRKPGGEQRRVFGFGVGESFELPSAVIDVVEVFANFRGGNAAGARDGFRRFHGAAQRAGVDMARLPGGGDTPGDRFGLGAPLRGEVQRLAAAKAFGLDALDVPMTDQQDLRHARNDSA